MQIKISRDLNGNKIVSIPGNESGRGYSIQTNGNLPAIHRLSKGKHTLTRSEAKEIRAYLTAHGTNNECRVFAQATYNERNHAFLGANN